MHVFQLSNILMMLLGTAIGIFIGSVPGLGTILAISLLIPITYGMSADSGLLLLLGVYTGGCYGGSISAILINTPGTAASVAISADGFEMTKRKESNLALHLAL